MFREIGRKAGSANCDDTTHEENFREGPGTRASDLREQRKGIKTAAVQPWRTLGETLLVRRTEDRRPRVQGLSEGLKSVQELL